MLNRVNSFEIQTNERTEVEMTADPDKGKILSLMIVFPIFAVEE